MVQYDSDAVNILEDLYEQSGNTIALQYGGSQMVHTLESYRSDSWTNRWKDSMQTMSRFYSNTFSDFDKQAAINLFLGIYEPPRTLSSDSDHAVATATLDLWELPSDFYLHHPSTRCRAQLVSDRLPDPAENDDFQRLSIGDASRDRLPTVLENEYSCASDSDSSTSDVLKLGAESSEDPACRGWLDERVALSLPDAYETFELGNGVDRENPLRSPISSSCFSDYYKPWEFTPLKNHFIFQVTHSARVYG